MTITPHHIAETVGFFGAFVAFVAWTVEAVLGGKPVAAAVFSPLAVFMGLILLVALAEMTGWFGRAW